MNPNDTKPEVKLRQPISNRFGSTVALIVFLIGLTTIYFVKDRPAKAQMIDAYNAFVQKYGNKSFVGNARAVRAVLSWDNLKKEMKERDPVKSTNGNEDIATYTWKGFLQNYQIFVKYWPADMTKRNGLIRVESIERSH